MKANEAPEKIFVNPNALQNSGYNGKNYMFIHDSVFDESKCTIEYTRTDVLIKKACEFLDGCIPDYIDLEHANVDTFMNIDNKRFIEDFRNYMKGK